MHGENPKLKVMFDCIYRYLWSYQHNGNVSPESYKWRASYSGRFTLGKTLHYRLKDRIPVGGTSRAMSTVSFPAVKLPERGVDLLHSSRAEVAKGLDLYFRLPSPLAYAFYGFAFPWPRGLRRSSTVARLFRLWVRISQGSWMFVVSVVCCQVEVSATSWSLVQRSPTDCCA